MSRIIANNIRHNDATADNISLDSNARVGIGTSSPSAFLHVQNGEIVKDQDSSQNSANPGFQIKHNGTINGSWRHDGRLEIGGQDANADVRLDTEGIKFNGDTAAANALNDYEEGTFVPELANSGTSLTLGSSYNDLHYTKIGQLVAINGRIQVTSASGSSGAVYITNMPFVCKSGNDTHGTFNCYGYNLDIPSITPVSTGVLFLEMAPGSNDAYFNTTRDDATWHILEGSAFDSGSTFIHIQGTYLTDS